MTALHRVVGVGTVGTLESMLRSNSYIAVLLCGACSTSSATSGPDAGQLQPDAALDGSGSTDASETDASDSTVASDAAGLPCDPVKQDCPDPSLKCTYIKVSPDFVSACATSLPGASANEGEACQRTAPGQDNCVKGTACLPNGANAVYACRKLCATDSQCTAGQKCAAVTTKTPYFGVCYPTCTPFSTECGGGTCSNAFLDNDGNSDFEACRNAGSAGLGAPCTAQWDCQADMNCYGKPTFTCHLMCDATHLCGDAGACTPNAGLPNGGGLCQ